MTSVDIYIPKPHYNLSILKLIESVMESKIDQINNQFVRLTCSEGNIIYEACIRVGSISGIIDHGNHCTVVTSDKKYLANYPLNELETKLNVVII